MNNQNRLLSDFDTVQRVATRLSGLKRLEQLGESGRERAWAIAHHLSDIEESCSVFLNKLLPSIVLEDLPDTALADVMNDVGEEFRHILYHIREMSFYDYLFEK